ncbi:hypothetical protein D3C84_720830 [compost metagenome]
MLDNQAFGSGADLPGVLIAANDGGFHRIVEVGIVEHDKGVGTTELQYTFFQRCTGLRADGHAGSHAAGEGHRCNA